MKCRVPLLLSIPLLAGALYGQSANKHTVYVDIHGWHTGIVLRKEEIPQSLIPEVQDFSDVEYVEFGWGDEQFYMTPGFDLYLAARALFWPTSSVLHVAGFSGEVERFFSEGQLYELTLTSKQFRRLCVYLSKSFQRTNGVRAVPIRRGWYAHSWFYPSKHDYSLLRTCNVWVAEALQYAGLDIEGQWAITSSGLGCRLRGISKTLR